MDGTKRTVLRPDTSLISWIQVFLISGLRSWEFETKFYPCLWWTVAALSISNLKEKIVGFVICNSSALDLQLFFSTKNTPSFLSSSDHILEISVQFSVWGMCKFFPPPISIGVLSVWVRWKPWAWPFHSLHKNANPWFRYFPTIGTVGNVSLSNYKMHWN